MLQKISQRLQTWMDRLRQLWKVSASAPNQLVKRKKVDQQTLTLEGQAGAGDGFQEANSPTKPANEHSDEIAPKPQHTEVEGDKQESRDNPKDSSPKAFVPPFNDNDVVTTEKNIGGSLNDPIHTKPEPLTLDDGKSEEKPSPNPIGLPEEDKTSDRDKLPRELDDARGNGKENELGSGIPREIGSRRTRPSKSSSEASVPQRSLAPWPELVCRRSQNSLNWNIVLSVDDECQVEEVQYNGQHLDIVNGECNLLAFIGQLSIVFKDGRQGQVPLFDDKPLIFKFRNNWKGNGQKVRGITIGHYIVITPNGWTRIGHVPVEQEGCTDINYTAHYFFRHESELEEEIGGFQEHEIISISSDLQLVGERVFDDSDDGELFVNAVPSLEVPQNIIFARVGEEEEDGWSGENFRPAEKTLSEVLNGREGRFFIRVYDEAERKSSDQFRFLRDLQEIQVNEKQYTKRLLLVPPQDGYPPTRVRFIGADGSPICPTLPFDAERIKMQGNEIIAESHPGADRVSCMLETNNNRVSIVLNLPRIWWRMEHSRDESEEWQATPFVMTRQEFRKHADANVKILLRLPKRIKSVLVGFDDEVNRKYNAIKNKIELLLIDFVDYSQINQNLNRNALFKVQYDDKILTLIQLTAERMPIITWPPAYIKRPVGWRCGKGFSYDELQESGLTAVDVAFRSIRTDRRRRTKHQINIKAIREMIDA